MTSVPLKLTAASSRVSAEQESLLIRPVMTNQSRKPGASAGKSQIKNCVCYAGCKDLSVPSKWLLDPKSTSDYLDLLGVLCHPRGQA